MMYVYISKELILITDEALHYFLINNVRNFSIVLMLVYHGL